jgi:hypothetical protein
MSAIAGMSKPSNALKPTDSRKKEIFSQPKMVDQGDYRVTIEEYRKRIESIGKGMERCRKSYKRCLRFWQLQKM